MTTKNIEIEVCMGSSCYSRGSNEIIASLETAIKEQTYKNLNIEIKGCLCKNKCMHGPTAVINGKEHQNLSAILVTEMLSEQNKS